MPLVSAAVRGGGVLDPAEEYHEEEVPVEKGINLKEEGGMLTGCLIWILIFGSGKVSYVNWCCSFPKHKQIQEFLSVEE